MPRRLTTASPSRGGWRPLRGVAALALARYEVCAATLAYRLAHFARAFVRFRRDAAVGVIVGGLIGAEAN